MNRVIVLAILAISLVDANKQIKDNEVSTKNIDQKNIHDTNSSEERRWQPIFPKNVQKLIVNIKPKETQHNSTTFVNSAKKPMMLKMVPKTVRVVNEDYWKKSTTRQPLMKYRKYAVNPLPTFRSSISTIPNQRYKDKYSQKYRTALFRKMMDSPKKEDSSEEESESSTSSKNHGRNSDSHVIKTKSALIYKIRSRLSKMKPVSKFPVTDRKLQKASDDTSEEKEDRKEFIFVTPKQMKVNTLKTGSDESNEVTTIIVEHDVGKRKRSVNVIEEENLGTTVSGFKFTGKVSSLSSDLVFRNIHT